MPVMGHIGYTPQFKKNSKLKEQQKKRQIDFLKEALMIEKAGAFSIVLECLSPLVTKIITSKNKNSNYWNWFI